MTLYYIQLTIDDVIYYKIGYTKQSLKQRFVKWNKYNLKLLFSIETNRANVLEQTLIKLNHSKLSPNKLSVREMFSEDIFKVKLDTITEQYLIDLENEMFLTYI